MLGSHVGMVRFKCPHLHMGLNRLLWSFGGIAEQGDLWEGQGAGVGGATGSILVHTILNRMLNQLQGLLLMKN